jgi:hypothetical protein
MSHLGFRAAWKTLRDQFGADVREFVDAQFAATPVAQSIDLYEEWQEIVQAMRPNRNG